MFRTVLKSGARGWEILVAVAATHLYRTTALGVDRRARMNIRNRALPRTECNHYRGHPTDGRNTTSTLRVLGLSPGEIRLAHFIKRDLEVVHWDNCKVKYSAGMAFVFARDAIALSHERGAIIQAYSVALSRAHAMATDEGIHYQPSSTVSAARANLFGECPGLPRNS